MFEEKKKNINTIHISNAYKIIEISTKEIEWSIIKKKINELEIINNNYIHCDINFDIDVISLLQNVKRLKIEFIFTEKSKHFCDVYISHNFFKLMIDNIKKNNW